MRSFVVACLLMAQISNAQEKPIILWDLHGVLLSLENPVHAMIGYRSFRPLITHLSWSFIKDLSGLIISNLWQDLSSEEYLMLTRKHNNPYLEDLILQIANAQTPLKGMDQLVFELAKLGYTQHIASNIGPSSFSKLIDPKAYPALAPLFKVMDIPASQISYNTKNGMIKKPNPAYFKNYVMKNRIDLAHRPVILIDDNKKNIAAARAFGFDAIHFKHPYQLRTELNAREIKVIPPPYTISHQTKSQNGINLRFLH